MTRELAENVWNKANLHVQMNGLADSLLEDVTSKNPDIQEAAAKALASLLSQLENNMVNTIVRKLMNIYQEKMKVCYLYTLSLISITIIAYC